MKRCLFRIPYHTSDAGHEYRIFRRTLFCLRGSVGGAFGAMITPIYLYTMIQNMLVVVIFLGALTYLGRLVYRSFRAKSACTSGCGKCGAVDFAKIEQQLKEKGI